jgi:hypothetical protein
MVLGDRVVSAPRSQEGFIIARPMFTEQRYLVHNEARIGRSSRPWTSRQAEVRWGAIG